ncbi:cytochrome c [Rhodobacteraceae bacterium D3-12]|nr:cytochrome c [Rhodobacteraceae bacterium D3-12]
MIQINDCPPFAVHAARIIALQKKGAKEMSRVLTGFAAGCAALGLLVACSVAAPHPGRVTFAQYCAGCHGATGMGDGVNAGDLSVPPADLTVLSAVNDGMFPTEHVMATVYGYPGKHAASMMPEFGSLLNGPKQIWVSPKGEEVMTPVALLELADYVERLQR